MYTCIYIYIYIKPLHDSKIYILYLSILLYIPDTKICLVFFKTTEARNFLKRNQFWAAFYHFCKIKLDFYFQRFIGYMLRKINHSPPQKKKK